MSLLGWVLVVALAVVCFAVALVMTPVYRKWYGDDARAVVLLFGPAKVLGLCGCGLFAIGITRGITTTEVRVFGAAFLLIGLMGVAGAWMGFGSPARPALRPDPLTLAAAAALAVVAVVTLIGALAPPTSNEWDVLAYHFAVPKKWLADGRIAPVPYDHHANFPMLPEMLYSIGFGSSGAPIGKVFHWFFGVLTVAATWWTGRRWVSPRAGWLAALLVASIPLFAWEATTAYIDLASTLYVTLSVLALICWRESKRFGWALTAGLMAGFSLGTKYTMVATAGLLLLWAAWLALRRAGVPWKHVLALAGVMAVIGLPWYIKNAVWTGNPVYPFFYSVLGGRWWSAQAAEDYKAEQARFGIGKTPQGFLMAPWTTSFRSEYYANPPAKFDGSFPEGPARQVFPALFGGLGAGIVGLLPLGLFARRRNPAVAAMLGYSFAVFLTWFVLTHQTRYLLAVTPLLSVAAAWSAAEWLRLRPRWRPALAAFVALAVSMGVVPVALYVLPLADVALGRESHKAFLSRTEPLYDLSREANRLVPANGRILLLQETRGYWLDRPYIWGNPSQNALISWATFASPQQMDRALEALGITHALVNWGAVSPDTEREAWPDLVLSAVQEGRWRALAGVGRGAESTRGITLYEIRQPGETRP